MAIDLGAIAERLFANVMAPLVLGGTMRPGHAIGARAALALGDGNRTTTDVDLAAHVQLGRLRRARMLAPIDTLPEPSPAEWSLAAALHDIVHAANPTYDSLLRRGSAVRILRLADETIDRVPAPTLPREALSRHTWLARMLDITRKDTSVSWWTGSRTYLGEDPPARLQAWPELRRVNVEVTPRPLLELTPLAVDHDELDETVARLLTRTPLTEIATCTRAAPAFHWSEPALALVSTRTGRTLALRALEELPTGQADGPLGVATRALLASSAGAAGPAVALLADRALALAQGAAPRVSEAGTPGAFARGLGAVVALRGLAATTDIWSAQERDRISDALTRAAQTPEARDAAKLHAAPSG